MELLIVLVVSQNLRADHQNGLAFATITVQKKASRTDASHVAKSDVWSCWHVWNLNDGVWNCTTVCDFIATRRLEVFLTSRRPRVTCLGRVETSTTATTLTWIPRARDIWYHLGPHRRSKGAWHLVSSRAPQRPKGAWYLVSSWESHTSQGCVTTGIISSITDAPRVRDIISSLTQVPRTRDDWYHPPPPTPPHTHTSQGPVTTGQNTWLKVYINYALVHVFE